MLYLEHRPHPVIAPFIQSLWYARDPNALHSHQRVLPTGRAHVVISLARDYLTDANHPSDTLQPTPPSLFLGLYSIHQHIDTIDLAELIGISFHPGGTLPFFHDRTDLFTNREASIEDLWATARALPPRSSPRPSHARAKVRRARSLPPPTPPHHTQTHSAPHHSVLTRSTPHRTRHRHRH